MHLYGPSDGTIIVITIIAAIILFAIAVIWIVSTHVCHRISRIRGFLGITFFNPRNSVIYQKMILQGTSFN